MAQCKKCGKKGLLLHVNYEGLCETCAQLELQELRNTLNPDQKEYLDIKEEIAQLIRQRDGMLADIGRLRQEELNLDRDIRKKKDQLIQFDEEILFQEFALYKPRYDFCTSDVYAEKLRQIRDRQKALIKSNAAVTGSTNWTVNNSQAQGRKMVQDTQKLLLRAFNSECDDTIDHVKYNNLEASEKRILKSKESISKLGQIMSIEITPEYYGAKVEELFLAFEYQQKKQQEKEEQKEARAKMREEAKLRKELEESRKKVEKDQAHYQNALSKIIAQIESATEVERQLLTEKKHEIEAHLSEISRSLSELDYRESNHRAGYVYVISNIGAFGEDVYKIGMTRRLDPMERIDELGDASVPFDFDVHAMIFSEDAPALENALHKAFADRKLNMVNHRREFFHVTLDEVKAVVKQNFDKTTEFTDIAPAEQYRMSVKMREEAL